MQQQQARCRFGAGCTNTNVDHWQRFQHPTLCRYHPSCTNLTPHHREGFSHPPPQITMQHLQQKVSKMNVSATPWTPSSGGNAPQSATSPPQPAAMSMAQRLQATKQDSGAGQGKPQRPPSSGGKVPLQNGNGSPKVVQARPANTQPPAGAPQRVVVDGRSITWDELCHTKGRYVAFSPPPPKAQKSPSPPPAGAAQLASPHESLCRDYKNINWQGNACKERHECKSLHMKADRAVPIDFGDDHRKYFGTLDAKKSTSKDHLQLPTSLTARVYRRQGELHLLPDVHGLNEARGEVEKLGAAYSDVVTLCQQLGRDEVAKFPQRSLEEMNALLHEAKEKESPAADPNNTCEAAAPPNTTIWLDEKAPVIAIDPLNCKLHDDAFQVTVLNAEEVYAYMKARRKALGAQRDTAGAGGMGDREPSSTSATGDEQVPLSPKPKLIVRLTAFSVNFVDEGLAFNVDVPTAAPAKPPGAGENGGPVPTAQFPLLRPATVERARCLTASHYIGVPEKLWPHQSRELGLKQDNDTKALVGAAFFELDPDTLEVLGEVDAPESLLTAHSPSSVADDVGTRTPVAAAAITDAKKATMAKVHVTHVLEYERVHAILEPLIDDVQQPTADDDNDTSTADNVTLQSLEEHRLKNRIAFLFGDGKYKKGKRSLSSAVTSGDHNVDRALFFAGIIARFMREESRSFPPSRSTGGVTLRHKFEIRVPKQNPADLHPKQVISRTELKSEVAILGEGYGHAIVGVCGDIFRNAVHKTIPEDIQIVEVLNRKITEEEFDWMLQFCLLANRDKAVELFVEGNGATENAKKYTKLVDFAKKYTGLRGECVIQGLTGEDTLDTMLLTHADYKAKAAAGELESTLSLPLPSCTKPMREFVSFYHHLQVLQVLDPPSSNQQDVMQLAARRAELLELILSTGGSSNATTRVNALVGHLNAKSASLDDTLRRRKAAVKALQENMHPTLLLPYRGVICNEHQGEKGVFRVVVSDTHDDATGGRRVVQATVWNGSVDTMGLRPGVAVNLLVDGFSGGAKALIVDAFPASSMPL